MKQTKVHDTQAYNGETVKLNMSSTQKLFIPNWAHKTSDIDVANISVLAEREFKNVRELMTYLFECVKKANNKQEAPVHFSGDTSCIKHKPEVKPTVADTSTALEAVIYKAYENGRTKHEIVDSLLKEHDEALIRPLFEDYDDIVKGLQ